MKKKDIDIDYLKYFLLSESIELVQCTSEIKGRPSFDSSLNINSTYSIERIKPKYDKR